eukprot:2147680-Pyramimonas_sp.AAC.1
MHEKEVEHHGMHTLELHRLNSAKPSESRSQRIKQTSSHGSVGKQSVSNTATHPGPRPSRPPGNGR